MCRKPGVWYVWPVPYQRRVVDAELDELLAELPAIALEGAKATGKTSTAGQRATSTLALDDPAILRNINTPAEWAALAPSLR